MNQSHMTEMISYHKFPGEIYAYNFFARYYCITQYNTIVTPPNLFQMMYIALIHQLEYHEILLFTQLLIIKINIKIKNIR
jgi:hypothetical protein